jgi:hypothetical protein
MIYKLVIAYQWGIAMVELDEVCLLERRAIVRRYFLADQNLISFAKRLGIDSTENKSYLLSAETKALIETIAKDVRDQPLLDAFRALHPTPSLDAPDFRGQYYTVKDGLLKREGAVEEVKTNLFAVLKKATNRKRAYRRYAFLSSLADLCKNRNDYWLNYWDGPRLQEIIRKMDEMIGDVGNVPAPQDYLILSAYGLYYKGGSNKYPAHCMPIEIIPTVEDALKEWRKESGL